jgi:hypothetical protein
VTTRRAALGGVLLLAVLYGALPWIAASLLPPLLVRWGIETSSFEFGYPRWNGIDVVRFELKTGPTTIVGSGAHVAYGLEALRGEVDSVVIDELTVRLDRAAPSSVATTNSLEMPAFWTLIPARRAKIQKLVIANAEPVVSAHGSLVFDPDVLQARLDVESPLLAVPLVVTGAVNPDGRVAITLMERGSVQPIGSLTGAPAADRGVMAFDGRIALTGKPLALAAAYGGIADASGEVHVDLRARAPWPLPADGAWKTIAGEGRYQVALFGSTAAVSRFEANIKGDYSIADGDVKVRLESGSAVSADVPQLPVLGKRAGLEQRVTFENDQDVDVEYTRQAVRVGDGLIVSLAAAGKPVRVRVRGALGTDRHFELGVLALDGAPIVLATGTPIDAHSIAVKGRLALTGKLLGVGAALAGVTATGGHVVADFEGATRWPLLQGAGLQNISGKGRARFALTGRIGEQQLFDVSLDGDYALADTIRATFDPGAHVVLSTDGLELSTVSDLKIEVQPALSRLNVDSVDFKLALAPVAVGKHTLALSNAWVTVERVSMDGDTIRGSAVLRTHTGRDALPVRVTLSHDLSSATGAFSLAGDWDVSKAVLTTQLPGFDAPYDLDEGSVALSLDGRWDASKTLVYGADGHVRINGRRAHYEDYPISGLAVDVPLRIDTQGYSVADTKVAIDAIDVGFPLTNVSLGLAVSNGTALIHDLSGTVLGGKFSAGEFGYEIATDKGAPTLELSGISLADVLALEGGDVRGSGTLDGKLPVSIDGEVFTISDGRIAARAPGGTLIYKGAAASSMVAQSGMGFVFQALEDFRFDTLDANVALAADGLLTLGVRLQGANPAVEQGRAIQFNLNLTESLPALLESLRAADKVSSKVEDRFVR